MHFTVPLGSDTSRGHNFSFGLVLLPCPVWVRGDERLGAKLEGARSAVVVIHDGGHGTSDDLTALVEDLEKEGFPAQVFGTPPGSAGEG